MHSDPGCGGCRGACAGPRRQPLHRLRCRPVRQPRGGGPRCPPGPPDSRRAGRRLHIRRGRPHIRKAASPPSPTNAGNIASLAGFSIGSAPAEHCIEVGPGHVGSEDEVDEAALVATTAPVVEALGRVLVEGAVAAAKGAVVAVKTREVLRDPQLTRGPQVGEHGEPGAERGAHEFADSPARSLHPWTTGGSPGARPSSGSAPRPTARSTRRPRRARSRTAATAAAAVITAVTGTAR